MTNDTRTPAASGQHGGASHGSAGKPSILKQPKQVWAVAFACVIAFMGIGLVDPILPAIAKDLRATETQTELLFTSYLLITGLAMLITSFISSRIGARATLLIGLGLIVVFAALAALSGSVDAVIGFRAGWGLGNALFISTALATIVGAASGGSSAAIILYEAALGLGIAVGPLVGGLLGSIAWQGPFFGVAVLMAIAFIAITVLLGKDDKATRQPTKLSAPLRALRDPGLLTLAIAALFYNIGFFTLLAWTPFALPKTFTPLDLGVTFFGWGLAVAVSSVWLAPLLTARVRRTTALAIALPLLALTLIVAGVFAAVTAVLVVCVIVGGIFLGVLNTVLTESVMEATDLPRSVASSSYSAVRFVGGAIAPPLAALIKALTGSVGIPFFVGAVSVLVATVVILARRSALARVDGEAEPPAITEADAIGLGDAA
ncbi:MFS transporter [Schumannella luteola]|uniref:Putative MFS family arabinose efflux permease n=1 Tax=Schumannella luteola TaxID=472059 RepID=A0A852YKD4_9MICO|nr:MFS transporter [Schumannella luteola]NYH00468.1 putative MFS family arabinose efflux permease [Schumannella luteola]TPX02304.1 MFS transporter [Schumannella luteola]